MAEQWSKVGKQMFKLENGKWVPEGDEEIEELRVDTQHWKEWDKLLGSMGAKGRVVPASTGSSRIHRVESVSPDGQRKAIYKHVAGAPISSQRSVAEQPQEEVQQQPVQFGNDLRPIKR